MGRAEDLIGIYRYVASFAMRNYYNRDGLAAQVLLMMLAVGIAGPYALDRLLPPADSGQPAPVSHSQRLLIYGGSWALGVMVVAGIWLVKRRAPRFRLGRIGILFAAKHEASLLRELRNLHDRVVDEIFEKGLGDRIEVETCPPNITIRSHEEALSLLTITRGRVLIWGQFETATRQGKEVVGFSKISVTCNLLPTEFVQKAELLGDSLVSRKWGWATENSIDRVVVAQNLAEVSRYVVGLSLLAEHRYGEAQTVLGLLRLEVQVKYASRRVPPVILRFQETIRRVYIISLVEGIRQAYMNELYEDRIFEVDRRTLAAWASALQEAVELDENVPGARLMLAIIEFLRGDIQAARQCLRQEEQRSASSRLVCKFSEAFLATFAGDYHAARRLYREIMKDPRAAEPRVIQPVLCFIEQAAAKYPEKPELIFILGLLNQELHDMVRGLSAFEEFVTKAGGDPQRKRWVQEANIRIQKIKTAMQSDVNSAT